MNSSVFTKEKKNLLKVIVISGLFSLENIYMFITEVCMNQNENLKMYTDNTSKYFPKYIYYKQHFFPEIYFTLFNH